MENGIEAGLTHRQARAGALPHKNPFEQHNFLYVLTFCPHVQSVDQFRNDLSHQEALWKKGLTYFCILFIVAGLLWSLMYYILGFPLPALIPGSYGVLSLSSLIFFLITGKFPVFRFFQFLLILILPVALQLSLGGFINSGAVMIWAILCPLGALSFAPPGQSLIWSSPEFRLTMNSTPTTR